MRKLLRKDHGQALVETALSVAVFLTLLIGVIQMAWALYAYHYVSYAARLGSRYAMVRGSACSGMDNCPNATEDEIQTYVRGIHFAGIDSSKLNVQVSWAASPQSGTTCTPPCKDPGDQVQVLASYPFGIAIPFVPASQITLHSTAESVIAQ